MTRNNVRRDNLPLEVSIEMDSSRSPDVRSERKQAKKCSCLRMRNMVDLEVEHTYGFPRRLGPLNEMVLLVGESPGAIAGQIQKKGLIRNRDHKHTWRTSASSVQSYSHSRQKVNACFSDVLRWFRSSSSDPNCRLHTLQDWCSSSMCTRSANVSSSK